MCVSGSTDYSLYDDIKIKEVEKLFSKDIKISKNFNHYEDEFVSIDCEYYNIKLFKYKITLNNKVLKKAYKYDHGIVIKKNI